MFVEPSSAGCISRIERGAVSPSLDTLWRVSAGLGMRPVLGFEAMSEPAKTGRRVPRAGRATVRVAPLMGLLTNDWYQRAMTVTHVPRTRRSDGASRYV
jgi:transcriptional regulator with XRE-family HTH domain